MVTPSLRKKRGWIDYDRLSCLQRKAGAFQAKLRGLRDRDGGKLHHAPAGPAAAGIQAAG